MGSSIIIPLLIFHTPTHFNSSDVGQLFLNQMIAYSCLVFRSHSWLTYSSTLYYTQQVSLIQLAAEQVSENWPFDCLWNYLLHLLLYHLLYSLHYLVNYEASTSRLTRPFVYVRNKFWIYYSKLNFYYSIFWVLNLF